MLYKFFRFIYHITALFLIFLFSQCGYYSDDSYNSIHIPGIYLSNQDIKVGDELKYYSFLRKKIVSFINCTDEDIFDIDEQAPKLYNTTALHQAVVIENKNIVQFLLNKGANIDVQDEQGFTPLHIAIMKGNLEIVETLVESKADVNMPDYYGYSPLHWALLKEDRKISTFLLYNKGRMYTGVYLNKPKKCLDYLMANS
jgi:ankyrin repeat protein